MPGSGKTSAGRRVARALGLDFIDVDAEVEKLSALKVSEIFERLGERYFRMRETNVLRETVGKGWVISCGGGVVLKSDNRELLRKHCVAVYFKASEQTLALHVGNGAGRPLLAGDAANKVKKLLVEREPLYEECADITVCVDGKTVDEVASEATRKIKNFCNERE